MILGYIAQSNNYTFLELSLHFDIVMGGLIRALCGMCFGITAYLIYQKLKNMSINKNLRILLTIFDAAIWIMFFVVWLFTRDNMSIFSVIMILPIAVAITFSGQSHIAKLFQFKWVRYFGPLSLSIYLNHWAGWLIVNNYFPGRSYKFCSAIMILLTAVACLLNYAIVKLGKLFWEKKLKEIFTRLDNT